MTFLTMASKAAVDFGNSNTVLAVWNGQEQEARILTVPGFSAEGSFLIPSLIAYEPDGRFFIGDQVFTKASADSRLFRWMKRYISLRSPYSLRAGGLRIDAHRAAEDFLQAICAAAFSALPEHPDELIISVPVESFEYYSEWLLKGMHSPENMHIRLIDEASAAAAGYGLSLHPGSTILTVDFGGSTLQAVCVSVMEDSTADGRACRVLGKAGSSTGGMTLDRWLYEEALKRLGLSENDPRVRSCSGELLTYCERFKTELSAREAAEFSFFSDRSFTMTREELEELFRSHGLFSTLDAVISEAVRTAEDHGLVSTELTAVVPVGGSCLIPAVRKFLESRFPAESVIQGEPLGAVARGAAVIAGGMHIYGFIQHDYAIRTVDPGTGNYTFRPLIRKGTPYPEKQITRGMKLKAAWDGQTRFGIALYEIREETGRSGEGNEIFFDTDGSVHVMPLTDDEVRSEQLFWVNEQNPLFLCTDQPAAGGEPCFEVSFGISENKMLTVTASDIRTGKTIINDHPVIRLV